MGSLSRVHKQRGRAGGSHGRGNLARHMARFPHAGDHNAASNPCEQTNRAHKTIIQNIGKRAQRIGFKRQHAAAFGKVWMGAESIHATLYEARALKGQ
jgi:hypothetical protein